MPDMFGDITTAMVKQYNSNIMLLSQQKQSRLLPFVRKEAIQGEFSFYDAIGETEAQRKGGRHSDTPLMDTPHTRRRVQAFPYNWATLVDKTDKLRMITDPTNPYTVNAHMAFNRTKDRIILEAALGPAYVGKEGDMVVPFPASQIIPIKGTTTGPDQGLTIDKLILTKKLFDQHEVDEGEQRIMVVSAAQIENLLRTTEVTNSDYNTVKALVSGQVDTFMGFRFVRTELVNWENGVRDCVAFVPSGLLIAQAEEVMTDIGPRRDKNNSMQIYVEMDLGATRMEEVRVVKVPCAEVQV